jgi:hypothetical protein
MVTGQDLIDIQILKPDISIRHGSAIALTAMRSNLDAQRSPNLAKRNIQGIPVLCGAVAGDKHTDSWNSHITRAATRSGGQKEVS